MFEESISIWASMNSWFTPTVLFVFLNLMIGTIAITSNLATHKHNEDQKQQQQPHQLARSPSMLQRLKSINFYNNKSQEPTTNYAITPDFNTYFTSQHEQEPQQQTHFTPPQEQPYFSRSPSLLQRLGSIKLYNYKSQEPTTNDATTPDSNTYFTSQHEQEPQQQTHFTPPQEKQPYFSRSPSMLQRLKSINLYSCLSQESTSPSTTTSTKHKIQETKTTHDSFQQSHEQEPEEEEEEEELEQKQTLDEIYSQLQGSHVNRSKSDTKPASGEIITKLPGKMKKSASAKSAFGHFGEEDIVETRRPATVREGKAKVAEVADDEVDAKADDFINKFKQQLKLQRIDSIIRYKDMITRGSGK